MASKKKTSKKATSDIAAKEAIREGKELLSSENLRFVVGLVVLLFSLYTIISFVSFYFTGPMDQSLIESTSETARDAGNWGGMFGATLSDCFINKCFGVSSILIPIFFLMVSLKLMKVGKVRLGKWFANVAFLMIWFSVAIQFFIPDNLLNSLFFLPGGKHGQFICDTLILKIGKPGTFLTIFVTAIIYFIYLSDETVRLIKKSFGKLKFRKNVDDVEKENETVEENEQVNEPEVVEKIETAKEAAPEDNVSTAEPEEIAEEELQENHEEEEPGGNNVVTVEDSQDLYDPRKDLEHYKFPPLNLLKHYDNGGFSVSESEKLANEELIRNTLSTFGVEITEITATVGPTVTLYEVTPASGVRIAKIRTLEEDIARSLGALGIRIIAPIPGKTTVGIEVPNKKPQTVSMESVVNTEKFRNFKAELPVVIGKTITNEPFMFDLAKMPHLLVAGATGQGKSVGLNAIITSLLYTKHPAELKLVLVDPKKVELSIYSTLENHFLAKVPDNNDEVVITDVDRVVYALNSLCKEMDTRYLLLKKARVRNIKEYNKRFCERKLNPEKGHRFLPYIVVIVDEFADLIMTAGKNVETPIARIAQLARAVGIHMIIATQRPTANIITGTIKANFPARIAFKVAQAVDSRTIIDRTGANRLIGRGDMLFHTGGEPVRVQCAFVDTPEVEDITNYIAAQQGYPAPFELPEVPLPEGSSFGSGYTSDEPVHIDPLFTDAANAVVESGVGSTSFIQRKFSIGYNRAGRIMDQLEKAGIVGPQVGSKPRDVLCTSQADLEAKIAGAF